MVVAKSCRWTKQAKTKPDADPFVPLMAAAFLNS
jgi:hypothetical protein